MVWEFFNSIGHLILFVPLLLLYSPSRAFGVFYCPGWLLYLVMLWSASFWISKFETVFESVHV